MEIKNTPLLNVQNTYAVKKSAIPGQAQTESAQASSIIDAGPAAIFERSGATNDMTGSVAVSRMQTTSQAGMLYAAGIMPMALEENAARTDGMSISGIADLVKNEASVIQGAEWSAIINPANLQDGSVISINDIKFEFDTDGNKHEGTIQVDISGSKDIAQQFVKAVQDNAAAIAKAMGANEDGTSPSITASWAQDSPSSEWKLQLTQSSDWAQDGQTFQIETGTFNGDTFIGSIQSPSDGTDIKLNTNYFYDGAKMSFTVGSNTQEFTVKMVNAKPQSDAIISGSTIQLYKLDDGSVSADDLKEALTAALKSMAADSKYTVGTVINKEGIASVTIAPTNATSTETFALNVKQDNVPEITSAVSQQAKVEPAYLEYKVDMSKLQNGDYFRFCDMCFIFTNSEQKPNVQPRPDENQIYIDMSRGPETTANTLQDRLQTYFAPSNVGSVPSQGSSSGSSIQYPTSAPLKRFSSDKFNIEFKFSSDNKLLIKIAAVNPKLLDKIVLEADEGWGRSETTDEGSTSGAEGAAENTDTPEETSEPENGETPDATNGAESNPDAPSPIEIETAPPVVQNTNNQQNTTVETEGSSDNNSVEETETDSTNAETNGTETTDSTEQANQDEESAPEAEDVTQQETDK